MDAAGKIVAEGSGSAHGYVLSSEDMLYVRCSCELTARTSGFMVGSVFRNSLVSRVQSKAWGHS